MNIELRVQGNDIERSHRVGPKLDKQGLIIMASTSILAEKIVRLIELVQSEECMWDMRSAVCHDRNKKKNMVQTIAESLELQRRVSFLPNQQLLPAVLTFCLNLDNFVVSARLYGSHISALN